MATEKTALITGASSGFGLLTTLTLAKRGWRVIATMRDLNRREELSQAAHAVGVRHRIEILTLDVTNAGHVAAIAQSVDVRSAPLHAVINNAGFAVAGFADDVTDAELRKQFETNFFGATAVTRACLPQMRRQGFGHIVMVSSISGRMGFPGVSSYVASKFALEGWTETLRMEMTPLGIQVVLVEPGSFDTAIWNREENLAASAKDKNSPNASRTARLLEHMKTNKQRANPQIVADGIARILDNPRPRLRYVYGKDAHLGLLLKGLLPSKMLERVLIKLSGISE
jgi:NAD(P)-dependent dehydrogenase (short-subunit alcohol dehydrogenase family)